MRMKFKSTTLQPKALLYKRFTAIESSASLTTLYRTNYQSATYTEKYWFFNSETQEFVELQSAQAPSNATIIDVANFTTILQYKDKYFYFNELEWKTPTNITESATLLSATFANVGKYQTNKYYYVGTFDYMIKGSVSGTTSQFIKGNILPLSSLNIKYFADDITLKEDDLVVIDKHLYSVEDPEDDVKYQPRKYIIHFATLNSIL